MTHPNDTGWLSFHVRVTEKAKPLNELRSLTTQECILGHTMASIYTLLLHTVCGHWLMLRGIFMFFHVMLLGTLEFMSKNQVMTGTRY